VRSSPLKLEDVAPVICLVPPAVMHEKIAKSFDGKNASLIINSYIFKGFIES